MKAEMSDTRRRVKLYTLNDERQWDDRGTGHVTGAYSDRLEGVTLMVRAESDGSLLLESKILPDTAYQKQQETLIVWSEGENTDLALSFQEKLGCDEIWEKICEVQGKDPSVDITQDVAEDGEEDDELSTSGRLDDSVESLQRQSTSPYVLPPCELGELDDIADLFHCINMQSLVRRDQLARSIEESDYIAKLVAVFKTCEDSENTDGLHRLFEIMKGIFLLNKSSLFDVMVQEENIMEVIGCLEHDPALTEPRKHREYLLQQVSFKEVLPIANSELRKKIHQTFRLQYIQDVVLPTPSVFEENMLSTLSSVIFFNKVEIVNMVQDDEEMLPTLFRQLGDDNLTDERRRELAGFVRELCCLSQTLQPTAKDEFFKQLGTLGILPGVESLLACDDHQSHRLAIDIFAYVVEHSPSMVRDFAHREMTRAGGGDDEDDFFLLNMIIEQMICDPDPELSCAMQLTGLLRVLLDPENMMSNKNEKTEFLGFFYRNCMHVLMAPVLANTADERGPSKDDYPTAHLLSLILDLVTFSVEHHTFHVKNYILNKDLLRRVLVLLNSRHKFLGLSALRFMRRILSTVDEFYNRYIIKGDLFRPIVDTLFRSGRRYNLINSAILEMFEFIRVEDIKSLTSHIVEKHYQDRLDSIDYVKTFSGLKLRYDQQQNRDKTVGRGGEGGDTPILPVTNHRFRRDARAMDEEEELWFERDDDDDVTGDDIITASPIQSLDGGEFEAPPKINIDSILEADNAPPPPPVMAPAPPPIVEDVTAAMTEKFSEKFTEKVTENVTENVALNNGVEASDGKGEGVKNGLIGGLVDYSDDDSDDDDAGAAANGDHLKLRGADGEKNNVAEGAGDSPTIAPPPPADDSASPGAVDDEPSRKKARLLASSAE